MSLICLENHSRYLSDESSTFPFIWQRACKDLLKESLMCGQYKASQQRRVQIHAELTHAWLWHAYLITCQRRLISKKESPFISIIGQRVSWSCASRCFWTHDSLSESVLVYGKDNVYPVPKNTRKWFDFDPEIVFEDAKRGSLDDSSWQTFKEIEDCVDDALLKEASRLWHTIKVFLHL